MVCGDGEYIIYTAMALRNKAFGSALQFIWNKNDASAYAVRESGTTVKIFKNFKEKATLRPDGGCEAIYAGHLLGVKSSSGWPAIIYISSVSKRQHIRNLYLDTFSTY